LSFSHRRKSSCLLAERDGRGAGERDGGA